MPTQPSQHMERLPNPHPERDYTVEFECAEFTCFCPRTGQPDFATVRIQFVPDAYIVELKSLKLYFWSYRDERMFHEAAANKILSDLVGLLQPRKMEVELDFTIRGGIHTVVRCHYPFTKPS